VSFWSSIFFPSLSWWESLCIWYSCCPWYACTFLWPGVACVCLYLSVLCAHLLGLRETICVHDTILLLYFYFLCKVVSTKKNFMKSLNE
jgi:hypothetical protein